MTGFRLRFPGALVAALASHRLTLVFFGLMIAGALWVAQGGGNPTLAALLPLSLLVANLAASIATRRRFRADLPLLLFHLALLAFVGLLGLARLIYFDGAAVLPVGTAFEGSLVRDERGPLHGEGLGTLRFANEGFTENFPERGSYHATYNRVRWWDSAGASHVAEIGDDRPLVLDGYRIYASARRGFAPLLRWQPHAGEATWGTVELPDHGSVGLGPASALTLPGGAEAWAMLHLDGAPRNEPGSSRANMELADVRHHLVLRVGERRAELRPGESLDLEDGRLSYVRLSSWMGYRIVKDPTEPWLVATVVIGIGSLLWFYAKRLRRPLESEARE